MFTQYTFQDWQSWDETKRVKMLPDIIGSYRNSEEFRAALEANEYFDGDNPAVEEKTILRAAAVTVPTKEGPNEKKLTNKEIAGNRIHSNFLKRFVIQHNQYLLANGVTLKDESSKKKLGLGFDKTLEAMGEAALLHGVCWGFWNLDHLEMIQAVRDKDSGFVALLDEMTGAPMVGVQFWRLTSGRPLYVRLFEADGMTMFAEGKHGLEIRTPKRAYRQTVARDAAGGYVVDVGNYDALPVIPFFANEKGTGELTAPIKTKIDLYDRIFSDFGDNLDRANDVYWVLNNFGGTTSDIVDMLEQIAKIKAVVNISDGTGSGSTAEPHTIEVPYAARQTAMQLLEKELYKDTMAMNSEELTGGSLTNVAIRVATTNLNLYCNRFEWQAFQFVQKVLRFAGVETEGIKFKRQTIANDSEIIGDIYQMREDIDQETALKLNPYIDQEEIPKILVNMAAESVRGLPDVQSLRESVAEE